MCSLQNGNPLTRQATELHALRAEGYEYTLHDRRIILPLASAACVFRIRTDGGTTMLRRTLWCHSSLKSMNAVMGTSPVVARGAGGGGFIGFAARAAELHVPTQHNALAVGTRAASWNASTVTETAHRSHPSFGRVYHPRREAHHHHHTRRLIIEAGLVERLKRDTTTARLSLFSSSSFHTNASSLRYDAAPRDDDDGAGIAKNLTREIADGMRVHDIVRPRDRCDLSAGTAAEEVFFSFFFFFSFFSCTTKRHSKTRSFFSSSRALIIFPRSPSPFLFTVPQYPSVCVCRVVVCVSGGLDSVALLHILAELREEWKLGLHVLHFNHGKRAESEEEESFIKSLSARLGVEAHVRHPEKPFEAANFQAKARAWRREEAQKLLDKLGAQVILQGHHADDQTETVLLKILRGCHLSRVSGMARREGNFGRPLLDVSKDQLREFLTSRSIAWREDASNADAVYLRNRVRAELVPLLRELTHGPLEARLRAITTQSRLLRNWLDEHPSAILRTRDAKSSTDVVDDDAHIFESESGEPVVQETENWDASARRYLFENGELDMNAWLQLPGMAQEDQLYEYVLRSTGLHLRYHNLRMLWKHMQTDNISWDWRIGKEWNLVRAGERVWTQRMKLHPRGGDDGAQKKRQTTGKKQTRSLAAVEPEEEEARLNVEHGVVVSYPKDWTVRAFWEDDKGEDRVAVFADEGVRLANIPEGAALRLRMRQPKDRFRCPRTRRDGKAVLLKDWMRNNEFPLHARERTPVLCLNDGEVVAVYPGFLAAKVTPSPDDDDGDGDVEEETGGRRRKRFLRLVIDRVRL